MKFKDNWKSVDDRIMTPGSIPAIGEGCTCDVRKNHFGLGQLATEGHVRFHPERTCPVHRNWPVNSARKCKKRVKRALQNEKSRILCSRSDENLIP